MKKNKAIAIFCLLIIMFCVFVIGSSVNLNKKEINRETILARVEQPNIDNGSTNSEINSDSGDNEEQDGSIQGVIDDMDSTSYDEIESTLDYDHLCNNKGFKDASKIIGVIIMIIKWLVPLVLMITGMIDFGKAIISSDDSALSTATQAFIKRLIISIIIPILPGLLYYLIDFFANTNNMAEDENFITCTNCLRYPFSDCINPKNVIPEITH